MKNYITRVQSSREFEGVVKRRKRMRREGKRKAGDGEGGSYYVTMNTEGGVEGKKAEKWITNCKSLPP